MLRLILAGLLRRRWQSLASLSGVALGVALLFAVYLLQRGLVAGIEQGRVRLGADLVVVPSRTQVDPERALFAGSPLNVYMPASLVPQVAALPGVKRVEAQFFTQSLKLECCSVDSEIRLVGIEPQTVERLATMSREGAHQLAVNEVIVGGQLLGGMGKRGTLVELLGKIFKIGFRLEPTGTALDYSILLPMEQARQLAKSSEVLSAFWRDTGNPDELVSAVLVEVTDESRIPVLAGEIERLGGVKVVRASETFQRFKRLFDSFLNILVAAGLLTAVGGLVYLYFNYGSSVWDRKGEWALYRSLGATRGRVVALVSGEAAVLSLAGATLGLGVGYLFYRQALQHLATQGSFPFIAPGALTLVLAATGALTLYLILGLLAAALPAWQVSRIDPALAMVEGDLN